MLLQAVLLASILTVVLNGGVPVVALKLTETPGGSVPAERLTVWLKPPVGRILAVMLAEQTKGNV